MRTVEIGMLVVETVVRIRREYAAGKPIRAIARDLKLSRKVVRKAVRAPEGAFTYKREVQPLPKIGPFRDRLDVLLAETQASSSVAAAIRRRMKPLMWATISCLASDPSWADTAR